MFAILGDFLLLLRAGASNFETELLIPVPETQSVSSSARTT